MGENKRLRGPKKAGFVIVLLHKKFLLFFFFDNFFPLTIDGTKYVQKDKSVSFTVLAGEGGSRLFTHPVLQNFTL